MARCARLQGVGIDIHDPTVHFAIRRAAVNRRKRFMEWPVVEHAAVDERDGHRIDVGPSIALEVAPDEVCAARPRWRARSEQVIDFDDPRRRKRSRK